jgi:transposase, IS6 family
VRW